MAPLTEEGETLGLKHRNHNKLVNESFKNNPTQIIAAISHEDQDLDNLFKIDIACKSRNVEYILETLKCDDMLYVSRAIKQSTWLITDQQYSHIINAEYLYNHLYPQMTSKAYNKLVLHIRLHLKDENRVEEFFTHYKQRDLKKAIDWLPGCSIPFIENTLREHANDIPNHLLKRLYEKSITFMEILLQHYTDSYYKDHLIKAGIFILRKNPEKFLDVIDLQKEGDKPSLGPKYTKIVMDKYPERIMNNLEKYIDVLDHTVFAKYLKKEEVKDFILKHIKNEKTRSWFTYKKIRPFLNRLPFEERFDFVKTVFIEKSCKDETLEDKTWDDIVEYCNLPLKGKLSSSKNIYSWYVYAPFNKAFEDLKELIRKESNPTERIWILRALLTCTGSDQRNILELLQYYHKNHINEPFLYKIQFVNHLISKTDSHRYDEESWGYLNGLFNSLEVYTASNDSVQTCVRAIILYHVMHGKNVPEIIENKFNFKSYIAYEYEDSKNNFDMKEREKIFHYLYNFLIAKIKNDITTQEEFDEAVEVILKVLKIIDKWNRELKDYPLIIQKVKYLITIKKENSWSRELSDVYHFKKSWRKLFFPESIILSPTQDSCINALKHNPELLDIYRKEINLSMNEKVLGFDRFLRKIQIYFYRSLSDSFKTTFMENLNQVNLHKPSIKGLCILLSQKDLLDFVQKYVPKDVKIDWNQTDDLELSIRKNIATCMHLSRPQPALDVALLYAKGDYLKYVLPSLMAIFYNITSTQIREHIATLLNTPVSLQKHGIRVAFAKLNYMEIINKFSELWKSSKNRSIRKDIFCETYKKLCKESDETVILKIWELLRTFVDELTFEENNKIYLTLSQADKVPLSIRPAFWMKSYGFLKNMPVQSNGKNLIDRLKNNMDDIMEFLDADFMEKMFFENFDKMFTSQKYDDSRKIAQYLLSTKSESVQNERYEKIFVPLIDKAIAVWDKQHENIYYARNNLFELFNDLSSEFEDLVLNKGMVFPIAMYNAVLTKLQSSLSTKENYVLLTNIKLSLGYITIIYDLKTECSDTNENLPSNKDKFTKLYTKAAPVFGKMCLDYLKEDVAKYFPSIHIIFAQVLSNIFIQYTYRDINEMRVMKEFLESKDFIQGFLLVIQLIPRSRYISEADEKALRLELLKEISTHPSKEVATHYWSLRRNDLEW